MALVTKNKRSIDEIVKELKETIPYCAITQDEIDLFRPVYEQASVKSLNRMINKAESYHAQQPISFMTRQLGMTAAPKTDSAGQITHDWQGRTVETGTDWPSVYARLKQKKEIKRQNYDAKHGKGSYDRNMKLFRYDLHKYFVGLCDKKSLKELQPLSKKIDQNGKELGIEVYQ